MNFSFHFDHVNYLFLICQLNSRTTTTICINYQNISIPVPIITIFTIKRAKTNTQFKSIMSLG